jgi:hypothetical protein
MKDSLGNNIRFYDIGKIYFGNNQTDVNFCNLTSHYYRLKDGKIPNINETANNISLHLESSTPGALRDIQMNLTVIPMGWLRVQYNYANLTGVENIPYQVPPEIVDIDNGHHGPWPQNLSEFINITSGPLEPLVI